MASMQGDDHGTDWEHQEHRFKGALEGATAAQGDAIPPDPGTAPIPEGHIRLWHYTPMANLPSVREHGLLFGKARSDLGNGDLSQPSAGVWASTAPPQDDLRPHGGRAVVEFHAHPTQVSRRADYPMSQDPQEWAKDRHHVIMNGDVPPSQFVAVHEPWHALYRAVKERHGFDAGRYQGLKGEYEADPVKNAHLRDYVHVIDALDRERGIQAQASAPGENYGYEHRPLPTASPIHDYGDIPGAYDRPHHHAGNDPDASREAVGQFLRARGKPDAPVRVYRAAPAKSGGMINTGDWVTTAHGYAHDLAADRNYYDPDSLMLDPKTPEETFHVYQAVVAARHVRGGGNDLLEWGYHGKPVQGAHHPACCPDHVRGALEEDAEAPADPSGDYKDSRQARLLGHFEAADRHYYHASYEDFDEGDELSGGHRLDDLYLADSIPGAHKYYPSGHVYEVRPHAEPQPSMEHEYTVPSATVLRKVPGEEVSRTVSNAYNAPDEKAKRDRTNARQGEHVWRVKNDRWYHGYAGPDKPGWDEYAAHWFPEGIENATEEQSAASRKGSPLPPEVRQRFHGTEASAHEAADEDYRTRHRPGSTDYGAPLHDVEDMMPGYHDHDPSLYDNYARAGERGVSYESDQQIRAARGNPDADVSIYRALPRERREINPGDWVTTSANYARQHAESNLHGQPWAVIKSTVKARHLFTEGDMNEWGYHGPAIADAKVHVHGGPRKKASVQHHGTSGEEAPEGHQIWAAPHGRSPVGDEVHHNMGHREPGDEHGSAWYQGISYHGPYHVIRHPETRQVWLVDRHGRDASPTGGHYGNPERDGNWGEHQAWGHQHGLESAGPEAHRFGTPDEPRLNLMNERVPEFPHTRVDPEDVERVNRPPARVHAPEGYSPADEYHGSYEVVQHPETGRYHVVDNAGRSAHVLPLNGFGTQLQAERSRDYTEKRQRSKEIGKGIAEGIWDRGHDALDPGGTPESRQSEENMRTASEMMDRYHGGLGEIKFDDDEEGGAPYYEREHLLNSGKPSGWYAKHYGGTHADIYHRATGDESHQTLRLPQHPEDENISMTPRLHPQFGDEHLAAGLKNWHDDEETGERAYIEANNPRISRWKQRHLAAAHEVVAHFEDPAPRPFTAAAVPGGGEEYGPKPEWQRPPEGLSDEERSAHYHRQSDAEHDWTAHIRRGLSLGHLTPDRAHELGYANNGHDRSEELWDHNGNVVVRRGWQPMPHDLYHATTNLPAVRERGLKSRRELSQSRGMGLGGGEDDTISLTADHGTAQNILRAMHEYHGVLNGRKTPQQMWEEAKAGTGAKRPFHRELANYHGQWEEGEPLPRHLDATLRGTEVKHGGLVYSPQEMAEQEGPGWRPHHESSELPGGDGVKRYNVWERDASPERKMEQASGFYKGFATWRSHAGGPDDPLFITNDVKGFAAADPSRFGIAHVHPRPGAQGYPLSSLREWRTTTGDALDVHRAERMEGDGHLKEASVSLAARYAAGLPNPQTGGDDWFHGTHGNPEDFVHGFSHNDSHDHEDEELRGHLSHWNTLLGSHFAADHGVAEHFARQGASTDDEDEDDGGGDDYGSRYQTKDRQSVIHARLHLRNPKHYDSEFDMDHEAYEHEYGQRKNYISQHFEDGYEDEDPHHEDYDPDSTPGGEEWPLAARYRHDDKQPIPRDQMQRRTLFSNPDMPETPERTRWLNSHPDKAGIARRFREHLASQGHDGILYGNEFEGSHATGDGNHPELSAIIFHPHQAEITQHHQVGAPCLGREEGERQRGRMPQPGQEELPGVEEHADKFPNGFLRGHAVVAHFEDHVPAPLGPGPYMQQKLFHQQPDPTLHAPESGRRNPEDPEGHLRWRAEHDEEYQPDECPECGGDRHFKEQHRDEHEAHLDNQDWYTDWEGMDMPSHIHRGMAVHLPQKLHDFVHDESVPAGRRATALAHHFVGGQDAPNSLGHYWSENPDQSKGYAEAKQSWVRPGAGESGQHTPVMVHARFPGREHIETDPETLRHWKVLKYGYGHGRDNLEFPIKEEAPVHLTGISWARPGHQHPQHDFPLDQDAAWTHHQFGGEGIRASASAATAVLTGGPDQVSDSEQRGDRWHEFQNRYSNDLHRGIHVRLPDSLHAYVHDEGEPREERAQALQSHFAHNGLGMHWTPKLNIANRAVSNAADEPWRYDDEAWGNADTRPEMSGGHTDVIFHVKTPGERNRLRNPDQLQEHEVGRQFSHDEDEFPLKPGSPLRLSGVSWKEHDPDHPMAAYEHHDFAKPVRHVSSVTAEVVAHFELEAGLESEAKVIAREDKYPVLTDPQGGDPACYWGDGLKQVRHPSDTPGPLYHGSDHEFGEGDLIEPGHPGNFVRRMKHVYMTEQAEPSSSYKGARGYGRHVYEVQPTGPFGQRRDARRPEWATEEPLRVVRVVPDPREHTAAIRQHYHGETAQRGHDMTWDDEGRQPSLDVVAHFSDFPFEDPEHERSTGHKAFDEAYEAVDRDSLWPKEHREFPALSTGMRPDFEDLPAGGEGFRWSEGSPHEHYFKHGPEGWRREDLHRHLEQDHHSAALGDAMLRAETQNGRGTADEYLALDSIHRRAHGRELGLAHSDDPGGTAYQELEHGHRWLENEADGQARQRQQEDDEDRRRQHSQVHGETMNLHEVEHHLRDVHGIPQHMMPAFHHTADDGQYTTPYSSELEELHDQDHAETGSYRHEEPDEEGPHIHGEEMGHEDAYGHLSEHHGHNYDELRSEEPSASRLEQYHEEAHDRERGTRWNTHHRDDPWDFSEGRARRVHPLEKDPDDEDEDDGHHTAGVMMPGVKAALDSRTAAYDYETDEGPFTWDEIARRHPRVYGDDEDHAPGMGEGGGHDIGDAAAELYHDRPSDPHALCGGECHPENNEDMVFHPRTVDVNRIDYMREDAWDPRVSRAKKGFQDWRGREKVPPLILVHRHGVYHVADGHHRANGAHYAGWPSVRAYVAYSPHEDEPFAGRDGDAPQRGPFHGAETEDRPPVTDHNGEPARRISFPGFPHTTERERPQAHEASRQVTLIPVYDDTAPALEAAPSLPCPRVDAVVDAIGLLGAWDPQDARDAALGVIALKEVFEALQGALGHLAGLMDEMPVHQDVAEQLWAMSVTARTAAADCERTAPEAPWEEPPAPPNR